MILFEDATQLTDNLWLSGQPKDIQKYKYVFAFNGRPAYYISNGQQVVVRPFDDSDYLPDVSMLHEMADLASSCVKKGPTLLHCTAGMNRSALIAALVLIKDGMSPSDAIEMIREKRFVECLSNKTFHDWLLTQQK